MGTKHKHAELIKAWADGARIQCFSDTFKEWIDVNHNPSWRFDRDYRIEPEPKPDYVLDIGFKHKDDRYEEIFFTSNLPHVKPKSIIRVTIDGETNEPKAVELVNG